MSKPKISKTKQKEIAKERIKTLFEQASKSHALANRYVTLANRYVTLARKIAMKVKVRIPVELKRRFCKHCYKYLHSKNSRVRTRDGKVVISCLECKKFMRVVVRK